MASIDCYLCIATATSGAALNSFASVAGDPLGSCHFCSVFACGHHALRNSHPRGWECAVCVPSYITPPPGRGGGGPTSPPGGGPQTSLPSTSTYGVVPYSEDAFVESYPTASDLLRRAVRQAIRYPLAVFEEYFGTDYQARLLGEYEGEVVLDVYDELIVPDPLATRLAATLAFIEFADLPDELLAQHLRRRAEAQLVAQAYS